MNIGEILIWESTNALLLIPVVIGLVMLTRWIRGKPVFTDRDWLFLFGHPRDKVLSLHLWLRFAALWFAVVLIGFVEGYVLLPFGLASFLGGGFSHRACSLARYAEVVAVNSLCVRRDSSVVQFNLRLKIWFSHSTNTFRLPS